MADNLVEKQEILSGTVGERRHTLLQCSKDRKERAMRIIRDLSYLIEHVRHLHARGGLAGA